MKHIYKKTAAVLSLLYIFFVLNIPSLADAGSIRVYEAGTDGSKYELSDRINCPFIESGEELLFDFDSSQLLTLELYDKNGSLLSAAEYTDDASLGADALSGVSYISAYLNDGSSLLDSFTLTLQDENRLSSDSVLDVTTSTSDKETAEYHPQLLVSSVLLSPNYKGLIFEENGVNDIELEIHASDEALSDGNILTVSISDKDKNLLLHANTPSPGKKMFAVFSSGSLPLGDYSLEVMLISESSGEILDRDLHTIRKRSGSFDSLTSYIDQNGRFIKNGKPVFYTGVYASGYSADSPQLSDFGSDGSVDSLLSYWQGMDGVYSPEWYAALSGKGLGNIANMRVFYESSDDRINFRLKSAADEKTRLESWTKTQRSYDSLDMYYAGDEEGPGYNDKLRWHSDIISSHDLSRPTLFIDWRAGEANGFLRSSAADIVGIDYYPLQTNTNNIGSVAGRLRSFGRGVRNRPVFMVLQCANYDAIYGNLSHDGSKILPSYTHLMNMAMQSVCAGATGIMWYHYYYLMNDTVYTDTEKKTVVDNVKKVSSLIKSFSDIILSDEEAPQITAAADGSSFLNYIVKRYNGKSYIFAVNTSNSSKTVDFTLSGLNSAKSVFGSEGASVDATDGNVSLTMDGLGYAVIELEQDDFKSSDCSIHSLALYADGKSIIYSLDEESNVISASVPGDANQISFFFDIGDGAALYKNGVISPLSGVLSHSGEEFALISENNTKNEFIINYSFFADDSSGRPDISYAADGSVSASGKIYDSGILCIAAYDDTNALTAIDFAGLTYAVKKEVTLTKEQITGKTVKVFLWKKDLKPVNYEIIK